MVISRIMESDCEMDYRVPKYGLVLRKRNGIRCVIYCIAKLYGVTEPAHLGR